MGSSAAGESSTEELEESGEETRRVNRVRHCVENICMLQRIGTSTCIVLSMVGPRPVPPWCAGVVSPSGSHHTQALPKKGPKLGNNSA